MRRRLSVVLAMGMMLAMMLALMTPVLAAPVKVGNVVAGPVSENVTVAGDAALLPVPIPPDVPLGTDVALTGNPIPPNVYAEGVNVPFEFNQALAGVGAEDDVGARNVFFGPNEATAGWGNLSIDIED